jgi:hypothetical protein
MGRYQAAARPVHDTGCMFQESLFPFQTSLCLDLVPAIIVTFGYYCNMKGMLMLRYTCLISCYAKRALMVSNTLYRQDQIPLSGQGESIESLPMIYLLPLQTTVLLNSGTNQMNPITMSFNGPMM